MKKLVEVKELMFVRFLLTLGIKPRTSGYHAATENYC